MSYNLKTKGINYKPNPNKFAKQTNVDYYIDKSWRCSPTVSSFITKNIGIEINSHKENDTVVSLIENEDKAVEIFNDKKMKG